MEMQAYQRSWESLPEEILLHIFSGLHDFDSLEVASLVCSSWHQASLNRTCWDPLQISDHNAFLSSLIKEEETPKDPMHRLNQKALFVVRRCGSRAKSVSARSCVDDAILREIAQRCPSIESLSLRDCTKVSGKALCQMLRIWKELKFVDLRGSNCLSTEAIEEIEGTCPNLEGLNYGGSISYEMAEAIGKKFPNLKWLNISGSGIDGSGLRCIMESCRDLEHLNVMGCGRLILDFELSFQARGIHEFKFSSFNCDYDHDYDYFGYEI
ncbi:hypothetical protein AMTRI_Chr07g76370 [Amborella trichopoda]|uniref:F-box domain-containing protein n=1 Tax=Amborella trichopoda TaxID=13333 RepID=U5CRS7_AMBTC|nr:F-box/LRR-repeat protein At3g48880-like [Amborella trichopoda]ERN15926.1 hypothetical protein AMTR_s00039p00229380 [Amborella trichopoda]|eukprot:XP_020529117.1 F-box/LRR-repeat protein At3g48880-like [Amborella trichopoda]